MMAWCKGNLRLLTALAIITGSQPACAENLASAVHRALRNHPGLAALRSDVSASREAIYAADGINKPKIALAARASYSTDLEFDSSRALNASISATQSLYDGGYAKSESKRTRAAERSSSSSLADQAQVVTLETAQAYMEVQRSRGMVRLLAAHVQRLQILYTKVAARVRVGVTGEVELYDTASKIDAAKVNLLDTKTQLADAIVNYRMLVGRTPGKLDTISAPTMILPRSADEAVSLALDHSPKIMAVTYDALAADAAVGTFDAANRGKIDLSLAAQATGDMLGDTGVSDELSAAISFRFDLYDGGTNEARARQARHQATASRERARSVQNEVERQVRLSWNSIHVAGERRKTLAHQLANARRALQISLKRYIAGVASIQQMLDQHVQLAASEAAWLNAEFTHRFNVYRVLAGTGRLTAALNIQNGKDTAP